MLKKMMKFSVLVGVTVLMTGCASINLDKNYDWSGKIWSAVIVKPVVDTNKVKGLGNDDLNSRKNYDVQKHRGLRTTYVHFSTGLSSVMLSVLVPDNIEFSEIPKNSLVEVMVEKNTELDFSTYRVPRVLRVVCDIKDKECINKEDKAKRIRVVLDEHPDASKLNEEYGLTFNRRLTAEELKKYK